MILIRTVLQKNSAFVCDHFCDMDLTLDTTSVLRCGQIYRNTTWEKCCDVGILKLCEVARLFHYAASLEFAF